MIKIGIGLLAAAALAVAPHEYRALRQRSSTGDAASSSLPRPLPLTVEPTVLGMNLPAHGSWVAEWAFNDPIKNWGHLMLVTDHGWADPITPMVSVNAAGRPVNVPKDTQIVTTMLGGANYLPAGSFNCQVSKDWQLEAFGDGTIQQSGTRFRMEIHPAAAGQQNTFSIKMRATSPSSNLDELACTRDGAGNGGNFNPTFLSDLRPFHVIRFMDWMMTNNAPMRDWASRPTPTSFSQAGRAGVSVEDMVALANAAKADPWFTLPFDASPDYYRNFATYVHDHLDPGLKAYVELSNEVWNPSFKQDHDSESGGRKAYPAITDGGVAADYYYADRVRDLMATWNAVFAGQEKRIVRVLATQAWPDRADRTLAHKDTWRSVDVLATAAYFGTNGFDIPGQGQSHVEAIIAAAPQIVDKVIKNAVAVKAVAAKYHLPYVTYEGGPDFQSPAPDAQRDLYAVVADPRMYGIYSTFLNRWRQEVGGLLVLYDLTGPGGYGHLQFTGQPYDASPKARALKDFADKLAAGGAAG